LIARHGPGLCSDARRCEGLLRDLCGGHRREINILVGALRERVPLNLMAGRNSVPRGLLLTRLAKRLEDQLALTGEASRWAVDSWALALGVVSEAELHELEGRRAEAATRVEEAPAPAARRPEGGGEANAGGIEDATPPRARQSPPPPPARTPAASTRTSAAPPASRATRTPAQGGPIIVAQRPAPPTHSSTQASNPGWLQSPSADPAPRGRSFRRSGCLIGCFLLVLLSVLLAVGVPFVVDILREEQQQRNLEPAPVQTR
ncbi:MAG: hypothetical protein ABW208_13290, partial [Pyrinomonadaceae bacterium]